MNIAMSLDLGMSTHFLKTNVPSNVKLLPLPYWNMAFPFNPKNAYSGCKYHYVKEVPIGS